MLRKKTTIAFKNMLRYLSFDIICSSKLTAFLELRSRKTVRFSEQIMSADKYLSIFSRQMEAIVYIYIISCVGEKNVKIKIISSFSAIKLCFAIKVLNNKAIVLLNLLNLLEYPLVLAHSAYCLVG